MPDDLSGAFHRPFAEQVAFLRRKLGNLVPTAAWDDMLRAAHDSGFIVAGAAKADLLTDLAAAVDKAIAEGRGIEEFRRDFRAIVARHGWTGWTGEGSVKGEAWRVKTILTTNSATSYAAGRLAQLRADGFKYWVYKHGGSKEPRIQHLSWDGLVLPADHEFWQKFYPPSDWGCSCYVVGANTRAAAKRLGGDPDKALPDDWAKIDPRTGAPIGIGRGWDYAPGDTVSDTVSAMAGKIGAWDRQISKAFLSDLPANRRDALSDAYRRLPSTADDARRYAQRVYGGTAGGTEDMAPLAPVRTLGMVRSDQAQEIRELTDRDIEGYDFTIDTSAIDHVIKNHGDDAAQRKQRQRGVTAADFARLAMILTEPDTIRGGGDSGSVVFSKRIDGEVYVAVMELRGARRRELALKTLYIKLGK